MSTIYVITAPDGAVTTRNTKDGMTHAVVRKFAGEDSYQVSLAGSYTKAMRELKNRAAAEHAVVVAFDSENRALASEASSVVYEEPKPAVKSVRVDTNDEAAIWAEAFKAGQDYALQCAFQGVVAPPANPYL